MSLLCWNMRGLGNPRMFAALKRVLRKFSPGVIFLSETKLQGIAAARIKDFVGYSGIHVDCRGKSGGLLLLWRREWDVSVLSFSQGHIDARITMDDGVMWRFSGFYGNPNPRDRDSSWELLRRLRLVDQLPWVCGGDFNEILSLSEKQGGSEKSIGGVLNFRKAVEDCDLFDPGCSGPRLTWNNKREGVANIQERLDRFLVDSQWSNIFPVASVSNLGFNFSDHRPILLRLEEGTKSIVVKEKGFKFEPFWLKEEECGQIVEAAWREKGVSSSVQDLKFKLNWCAARLGAWSSSKFGSLPKLVGEKQKFLDDLFLRSSEEGVMEEIRKVERELEGLLEKEEIFWRQRSRTDWLAAGDRNTKFFHAHASRRRLKNSIASIKTDDGRILSSEADIAKEICKYFANIFKSSSPCVDDLNRAVRSIEFSLSMESKLGLDEVFRSDEIKRVVFYLGPSKAPGPDGFHAVFFQKFWSVVGGDVTSVCLEVLGGKISIKEFNKTNIVLIPKKKNPESLKDFRPISLCSVVYKIIAKVLANRLKKVLPDIISPSQSAFVPGRLIFNNVVVAFEALHSLNKKKSGSLWWMALKLDMSKAYDRVEWAFLRAVLEKMNFPCRLVGLILDCISTSSFSFVLNGKRMGCVIPSRGLRQGCPLSPFLFVLCAEAFSCLIKGTERIGRGLGFKCCRGSPVVSHLFFADDSILFSRASVECCGEIKELLGIYERGSGQLVNLQKTSVTFSPNVVDGLRGDILVELGLNVCNSHDRYLGLPTLRVWNKVRGWNGNLFSLGGKEILIKAVAQAIPTYTMSIFQIPAGLCRELGALISRFWWGSKEGKRKISWLSWEKMCLPKACGGLGFKDLSAFNQALLAKQVWRFLLDPNSLVASILKSKYFRLGDLLSAPLRAGSFHIWRSLCWGRSLLIKGLRWKVGNGLNIRIFEDPWLPRPFSFKPISVNPGGELRVADLFEVGRQVWDPGKLRDLFLPLDREAILSIPLSYRGGPDCWTWHFDKKGRYLVSASSSSHLQLIKWWSRFWGLNIPPKIRIFAWRACLNALPTLHNLMKRKVCTGDVCKRCGMAAETTAHSLFWCIEASKVWHFCGLYDLLIQFKGLEVLDILGGASGLINREQLAWVCVLMWCVWWNRNLAVHGGFVRDAVALSGWAADFFKEFQHSLVCLSSSPPPPPPPPPFPFGSLKLNSDVAVRVDSGLVGVGAVIRGVSGDIVAAVSKKFPGFFSAEVGELIALREGLLLVKSLGLKICVAEVDASNVASMVNEAGSSLGDASFIVEEIKVLCSEVGDCRCLSIPRSGNRLAHVLASSAFSSNGDQSWSFVSKNCFPVV
ncbi:hypothetical protein ACOSQ2_018348 [Xanthoceras sorbifolium]